MTSPIFSLKALGCTALVLTGIATVGAQELVFRQPNPPTVVPVAPPPTPPAPAVEPTTPLPPAPNFPPPAPVNVAPPPPLFSSPLFLGQDSGFGAGAGMEVTLAGLNGMVSRYNGTGGILPEAILSGANLTVVPPIVPAATSAQTQSPAPTSGLVFRSVSPPPPPPAPVGPTELSIDVTGWSFLVLKWGEINYHFYVGDSSGVQTFKGTAPLASYSTFFAASVPVSVPDAGSSALLLAAGVVPLAVLRRRFRR